MSDVTVNVQLIQVNLFVNHGVDRTGQLISELNVHYNALLNYRENGLGAGELTKELIDAYTKLHELANFLRYENETRTILDSIITLLKFTEPDQPVREKLKSLGKNLVRQLHPRRLDCLLSEAWRYKWLRKYNLILADSNERRISFGFVQLAKDDKQRLDLPPYYKFEPTDIELEEYFANNKAELLHYLVDEVQPNTCMQDPMALPGAKDLYHYTVYLNQF
ncbi:hypothetical protein [Azotobacter chroococcum]|uniref:hypothetical protein n=1 Tax=Azotobacter chroococcum TaxID=353 RepID=UPI0010AEACEA|nr:hypothetical protein [Azotobacter chroococcum]TKD45601.1 hypothetical protein FCG41_03775 [Azotobacter chroococcum]